MKIYKPLGQVSDPGRQIRVPIQGMGVAGAASVTSITLPNEAADIAFLDGNSLAAGCRKALLAPRRLDFFVQESVNRRRI
ncbi:hypothetical protein FBF29_03630 [Candidatus Saccharibacteria bacterium oral taxon 488]|nr:hypothetical protein FBF29_03630 [Candidatus Saccharibacteria bacterium oral taxon 488]